MKNELEKSTEIQELVLEKIKFAMNIPTSCEMYQSANVELISDFISRAIICQFRTKILGNKKQSTVTAYFEVPLNWFEFLKEEKFSKWLKKLFPVKYTTISKEVEFTASALFPELGTFERQFKIYYYGS